MQLQARLVHADSERCVVLITAREGERLLGSALGEAAGAEEAEDRALARLRRRLEAPATAPAPIEAAATPRPPVRRETSDAGIAEEQSSGLQAPPPLPITMEEPPIDPEDWSAELAQLDLALRRLGWGRQEEATYLQRAFGHPDRNRLTAYADLTAYLRAIEAIDPPSNPSSAPVPLRRRDLLEQCDQLLASLGWDSGQGRQFLERHLGAASRRQLSDPQLLQFNMLLEGELIGAGG